MSVDRAELRLQCDESAIQHGTRQIEQAVVEIHDRFMKSKVNPEQTQLHLHGNRVPRPTVELYCTNCDISEAPLSDK